jgi:hypothetical protein
MRIVPAVSVLILTFATTSAFARRSRCQQVVCECTPVVCSSTPICVKPTTVCGTPQPTVVALEEKAVPVTGTAPAETKSTHAKRPKSPPVEDVEPELNAYLAEWENASSKIRRLDCEFQRFRYDPIFEIEKRGLGTLALEQGRRAKYRVASATLIPGDVSKKKGKAGSPYKLEACTAECWHWTDWELFKFDDQEHSYDKIDIHPRGASEHLGFTLFSFSEELVELLFLKPFVLGIPAEQFKGRFKVKLLKESWHEVRLELVPRRKKEFDCYEKAVLILDRRSWLTQALKVYDPTGSETVHIFQNTRVNSAAGDDLSTVNVEGYRPVLSIAPPKKVGSK